MGHRGIEFPQNFAIWEIRATKDAPTLQKAIRPLLPGGSLSAGNRYFKWWIKTATSITPKISQMIALRPHVVLYTDTAAKDHRVAAILFRYQNPRVPIMAELWAGRRPNYRNRQFDRANLIYRLYLLEHVDFIRKSRRSFRNKRTDAYVDNDNAIPSLVGGDSNTEIISEMVCLFWQIARG